MRHRRFLDRQFGESKVLLLCCRNAEQALETAGTIWFGKKSAKRANIGGRPDVTAEPKRKVV